MEKQKRWHLFLIVGVVFLTVFNILPTVFFYTKPLKSPIDEKKSLAIASTISQRVNNLEEQSKAWVNSFCNLLKISPKAVNLSKENPEFIAVEFKTKRDADVFKGYLPRAGALIPFLPAQLSIAEGKDSKDNTVIIKRKIPIHFDTKDTSSYFQFSNKFDKNGTPSPLYNALINDRVLEVALTLGGVSENAQLSQALINSDDNAFEQEIALQICQNIKTAVQAFGENSDLIKKYFSSFSQTEAGNKTELVLSLINKLESVKDSIVQEKKSLSSSEQQDIALQQKAQNLLVKEKSIESTISVIKRNQSSFINSKQPWSYTSLGASIQKSLSQGANKKTTQTLSLEGKNTFFESISIDWLNEKLVLQLSNELQAQMKKISDQKLLEKLEQFIFNQIAYVNRLTGEKLLPNGKQFEINLKDLSDSESFLAFRLSSIAKAISSEVKDSIETSWKRTNTDLIVENYPLWDYETYSALSPEKKKLGLFIYSPTLNSKAPEQGFRMNSIYVVAKGLDKLLKKHQQNPETEQARQFFNDFYQLRYLMQKSGFIGYSGSSLSFNKNFSNDFIFEAPDYFLPILMATREQFQVHGTKRYAVLEFSNVEQRIITENKIDTSIHEDLLKWKDDYRAAQYKQRGTQPFDFPKPTESAFLSNIKLSLKKYFRGDDRKILHWGLDLSGGKTIQIELRDKNNKVVTNETDIKQGINELYARVNKMGVSEVSIRQEGNFITLDFPGSQGLSATELVKSSSMFFHVVNEKFTQNNTILSDSVNRFLQDIWNEAVVTNKKSPDDLNLIAFKHLYGDVLDTEEAQPRSDSAKILFDNGLRIANPLLDSTSNEVNLEYSKIAVFRGEDYTEWQGQTHPLIIVFKNFALEGSNLENIHASYDPSRGNFLSFGVKGTFSTKDGIKISPRDDLSAWTTQFSKDSVSSSPNGFYSKGRGWRMAVVLNGSIISAPTLDSALRDNAMISGSFSQREVNQLEADLKAGSLTFTPKILSEKNVSPELGAKERNFGIFATIIALALVIFAMIGYYRFGGVVASIAVVFNLLIMWATLQNIQATLTLPMIAGLILTVGMAVDANVLVFERIREEFAVSGRIASAINVGYKKAFSAILDSNVTTALAGMVLLHFDSGPIKGFALTLIIGIVSSMFTALFMTRFFFSKWVENPKNKKLNMLNWFRAKSFDFLKYWNKAALTSIFIVLVGAATFFVQRHTIFGMDFTGGYALNIELKENGNIDYRQSVEKALLKGGLTSQDFQVRELNPSNNIRLFLSRSLELPGKPFHNLELSSITEQEFYSGENPRVLWVLSTLKTANISLENSSLQSIDSNWSQISGQMSETMRNNALIGLLIAMAGILVYITVRFEFKYAVSATICLAHDILITLGFIAILHALNIPLQIDLNIIAALMTIVGYSLNDTIIVFDRIREDVRLMRGSSYSEIINHSLNVTLSRTLMTSGTTLLVLIPLILLGGSTILGFSLVMAIGVIFGTLSSLFIAAPLMLYFHKKERSNGKTRAIISS